MVKTSCCGDVSTFWYFLSISVVQCEYSGRYYLYSVFAVFQKSINYVSQLFNSDVSIKKWHDFKREYDLHENSYFQWEQLDSILENGDLSLKTIKLELILSHMIII